MLSEATRELFALINLACAAGVFVLLIGYLFVARPRRAAISLGLLLISFLCVLNGLLVYFVR